MSSGVAKKEISSNPAPNAVTAPTDPKLKKVDVERKTKLYGIIAAFREGKYPSNRQIDETLDYVLKHEPIDTAKLSPDGRMLIQDFQNIIKTSKRMVAEKNADELFQNFLWETRRVDYGKGNLKDVNLPVKKDELDKDAEQALVNLKTLAKLIFTNSEARKILKDISILGQDVAADAAAKLSDVARPDDDKLAKTDEAAPSNQWVGPNGEVRSHNDPVPDTGLAAKRAEAQAKKEEVKQKATEEANSTADRVANAADGAQQGQVTDEDRANAAANAGADQAQAEGQRLKDKLLSSIPDEHKARAREQADKLKEYGREKFPKERRERYIYRLKKVIVENQRHRDYQEAIEFFLDRIETYAAHGKDVANQSGSKGLDVRNDPSFKKAEDNLRTLLERFANGQSMDPIFKAIDQLYTDAKNDEELRKWFKELDTYARQCLQEPGYIMRDAANTEGRRLLDSGKKFWDPKQGKYAPHKDNLFSAIETFFTAYADDALNVQLGNDVKQLTKNLLFDKEGNLQYKPHLWKDIRDVIIPTFAKQVGYIPIPRIEYTDPQVDLVIENLTLESQNIFPNIIELEARNYFKLSPYSTIKDASKHSFWLSFSQIQADLKDVAFYIKKKQGFPKLSDNGTADVFLGGQGISGKIHLESTGRPHHAFKVLDVKVKVDKFKFNVRSAKHSVLVAILRPLASGLIKKSIQKALEQAIREGLQQLDAQISDLKERYEDAKAKGDETGKLDALKQAYQDKKAEAEEAKREHTPKGQFQFTTNRDSKLINWSSPDSIVEKQGAKMDAARETGAGSWKSSAFDIVNGKSATAAPTTTATTTTAPRV